MQNAFAGIQVCVCVLILNAVLKLLKKSVVDKRTAVIFVIVLLGNMLLSVSPVWFVLLSALSGIVLKNLEGEGCKMTLYLRLYWEFFQNGPVCHRRRHGDAAVP